MTFCEEQSNLSMDAIFRGNVAAIGLIAAIASTASARLGFTGCRAVEGAHEEERGG